ncbi:hypothetical protein Salat_2760300 [Sesamum alatum]|uniref:Uncharacterized protein n=1 Tax=Sesamum alatum TaxID=300844 RepID=A0AAE2C910_9LAMI|nr:hypothetical protein Salat_2760300 [Sesamum alatum]
MPTDLTHLCVALCQILCGHLHFCVKQKHSYAAHLQFDRENNQTISALSPLMHQPLFISHLRCTVCSKSKPCLNSSQSLGTFNLLWILLKHLLGTSTFLGVAIHRAPIGQLAASVLVETISLVRQSPFPDYLYIQIEFPTVTRKLITQIMCFPPSLWVSVSFSCTSSRGGMSPGLVKLDYVLRLCTSNSKDN